MERLIKQEKKRFSKNPCGLIFEFVKYDFSLFNLVRIKMQEQKIKIIQQPALFLRNLIKKFKLRTDHILLEWEWFS